MKEKRRGMAILFCVCLLSSGIFSGCLSKDNETDDLATNIMLEQAAILPDWHDGSYHDYGATTQMLNDLNYKFHDLVEVLYIGKSVLGRDIWCIKINNKNTNNDHL